MAWTGEETTCVCGAVNTSCNIQACDLPCGILGELLPEFTQSKWTRMGQRVTIADAGSPGTARVIGSWHLSLESFFGNCLG